MFDNIRKMLNMSATKSKQTGYATAGYYHKPSTARLGYDFAKGLAYDNVYPSLSRIANEFMAIRPFAIDANGKPLNKANAIDALYHPNDIMSGAEFREAIATLALTHRKVYILAWHWEGKTAVPGGVITESNLAGFTIMEDVLIRVDTEGEKTYQINGMGREYTKYEVIELTAGVDPYNISLGYSPTISATKWANIDDFIANYEAGHFENGAVPAGQMIITAPTKDQFEQAVQRMQEMHRGSGNNNNIIYVHRPTDPTTGAPLGAQVEWVPFSQTNAELNLDGIFKQTNDKIDSAFGVPSSIRGVNDKNTYASVKVDERIFIQYTVKPFATKIWSKFTHELNRITGGLGYAITFELEEPSVADEEKADAERKATELGIIAQATSLGYSLDSVVEAFGLSNSYKLLEKGEDANAEIINDKPEVDEGEEAEEAPEAGEEIASKSVKPDHCTCEHKHDHIEKGASDLKDLRSELKSYAERIIENTINANRTAKKAIATDEAETYDETYAEDYIIAEPTEQEIDLLKSAILAILLARIATAGQRALQEAGKEIPLDEIIAQIQAQGGVVPPALQHYVISNKLNTRYENRIGQLVQSFTRQIIEKLQSETATATAGAIATGIASGMTREQIQREIRNQIEKALGRYVNSSDLAYIIDRIIESEGHRAIESGKIDAIDWIIQTTEWDCYKIWRIQDENACEFCKGLDGKKVKIDEMFVAIGETIDGTDGGTMLNDYEDMETPDAHPFCRCYYDRKWEKRA